MKISEIKAKCPFCGNTDGRFFYVRRTAETTDDTEVSLYYVLCQCGASGKFESSAEEAIAAYEKVFPLEQLSCSKAFDPVAFICQTRKCKYVIRFSAQMLTKPPNLMEHCYATASIFVALAKYWDIPVSLNAVDFVLNHDLLETETGDLLYPVKHMKHNEVNWGAIENAVVEAFPMLEGYADNNESLTNDEQWLFRFSDLLEGLITCLEEIRMGNRNPSVATCRQVYINALEALIKGESKPACLLERIQEQFRVY